MKDDHLPAPNQWCRTCQAFGDHFRCWETDLDLADVNPQIALHDAAHRVAGEAA